MDIAIVLAAFNRPGSLQRLLGSLSKALIDVPVTLYISIDGKGAKEVIEIARNYVWSFGSKELIAHQENLGLHNHILLCGDLSQSHDGIIIYEDDLFVAPYFHNFAVQALNYYKLEKKIAGISLYSHCFNETAEMPFIPLNDGNSVYFMQLASSWGQCFTRDQWSKFKSWYDNNIKLSPDQLFRLPPNVAKWPESSWKKYFICYMIENDLYFVYPRNAYCTNFADKGVNLNNDDHFQVPLSYGKENMSLCRFSESKVKYDSYCEILPECLNSIAGNITEYPFMVDLYGNKPIEQLKTEYILTSRGSSKPIKSFAKKMVPHEVNIIGDIQGSAIVFSHLSHVDKARLGFTTSRIVYYHRLPAWHRKMKRSHLEIPQSLNEKEEILLRVYNSRIGKLILKPVLFAHRLYFAFKACIN